MARNASFTTEEKRQSPPTRLELIAAIPACPASQPDGVSTPNLEGKLDTD